MFYEICRLSYKLIIGICQGNHKNELISYNYFCIYLQQVKINNLHEYLFFCAQQIGYNLGASKCIISIINNNKKLILLVNKSIN